MHSRRIRYALMAVATLAIAGCAVDGSAAPGEIDVRTLDVGKYPTGPLEERYTYPHDLGMGLNLALMRLANQVVTGHDIDPRFKYGTGAVPFLTAEKATKVLADVSGPVLERNNMKFGVAVGHSEQAPDKHGKTPDGSAFTTVTVMQFPDDATAARAATELAEADFGVAAEANQRVTLAKYPAAQAHWRPGVANLGAFTARGSYVISLFIGANDPVLEQLATLAEQVLDAQTPLLDALKPLDPEAVLRLPNDPDGMLRRTLNPSGIGIPDFGSQAVFEPRGFLHRMADQDSWRQVLTDQGVDRWAVSGTTISGSSTLFRTRDSAAALRLGSTILERSHPGDATPPPSVPKAECGESAKENDTDHKRFRCIVAYRQYVATVESDQLGDVHQRAAAQYALLANSSW